jgi:hypothetical protein
VLDEVRERLTATREARQLVIDAGERIHEHAETNGGGEEGGRYWEALRTVREGVEWFAEQGIILRDTESGLVDFPALREGRIVHLCWQLGEPAVNHWHEVDAGFTNRHPL